jgi:hypothetical protein
MFQRNSLIVLGLFGLAAAGCSKETTSSANIRTGGIAALIDVTGTTDTTAQVHVELKVGGSSSNTYVILEDGDKLTATANDQTKTLTATDSGVYDVTFQGVGADTAFKIDLERTEGSATNSGTLPAPFAIDPPTTKLSRKDDDLPVSWAPADTGDGMALDFSGTCIFDLRKAVSDTGSYVVKKTTLSSTGGDMPETCDITLDVDRSHLGTVDSAFDPESYVRMHQSRSLSFTSNP